VPFLGSGGEPAALRSAYRALPTTDFSTEILEQCPSLTAVSKLTGVPWCDFRTPLSAIRGLKRVGAEPPWLATLTAQELV
jgi:hypothetical protein